MPLASEGNCVRMHIPIHRHGHIHAQLKINKTLKTNKNKGRGREREGERGRDKSLDGPAEQREHPPLHGACPAEKSPEAIPGAKLCKENDGG